MHATSRANNDPQETPQPIPTARLFHLTIITLSALFTIPCGYLIKILPTPVDVLVATAAAFLIVKLVSTSAIHLFVPHHAALDNATKHQFLAALNTLKACLTICLAVPALWLFSTWATTALLALAIYYGLRALRHHTQATHDTPR